MLHLVGVYTVYINDARSSKYQSDKANCLLSQPLREDALELCVIMCFVWAFIMNSITSLTQDML